jgi:hypothetical protein
MLHKIKWSESKKWRAEENLKEFIVACLKVLSRLAPEVTKDKQETIKWEG